jgi:hypothetical protein
VGGRGWGEIEGALTRSLGLVLLVFDLVVDILAFLRGLGLLTC